MQHNVLHYWVADGAGELSSRFVHPICTPRERRHIEDFPTGVSATETPKCPDCTEIVELMEADSRG